MKSAILVLFLRQLRDQELVQVVLLLLPFPAPAPEALDQAVELGQGAAGSRGDPGTQSTWTCRIPVCPLHPSSSSITNPAALPWHGKSSATRADISAPLPALPLVCLQWVQHGVSLTVTPKLKIPENSM